MSTLLGLVNPTGSHSVRLFDAGGSAGVRKIDRRQIGIADCRPACSTSNIVWAQNADVDAQVCNCYFSKTMAASAEIAEQAVQTFELASQANHNTPSQSGQLVVLDADSAAELMITADLHGNRLNFERILRHADLGGHPRRHLLLQEVCHGGPTYPCSSACMSHLLLEDVARLKVQYPERLHFVLGNHELAEITDFPISKGNRMLNLSFRWGIQQMYGEHCDRVRAASLEFLRSCPLATRLASGVFICHSAPDGVAEEAFDVSVFERPLTEADLLPQGAAFRLVWGRDFRPENAAAFAQSVDATVLVHGHEPCPRQGYQVPNEHQIILDCCGPHAAYLTLPVDRPINHSEVVQQIQFLNDPRNTRHG
jgi:hypothetical protein